MKLGFVFNSFPHTSARGREGLDALLAASAYCDDIAVFFVGAGVTQLVAGQQPQQALNRDYIATFKLFDLYDIEQVYLCQQSLQQFGLQVDELVIVGQALQPEQLSQQLQKCQRILTF